MRTREEQNIVRRDLIQLLMEAKAGLSKKLSSKENDSEQVVKTLHGKDGIISDVAPAVQNGEYS